MHSSLSQTKQAFAPQGLAKETWSELSNSQLAADYTRRLASGGGVIELATNGRNFGQNHQTGDMPKYQSCQ